MAGYGGGYGGGNSGGGGYGGGGYGGNRNGGGGGHGGGGRPHGGGPGGHARGGGAGGAPEGFDPQRPYTSRLEAVGQYQMRFGKYNGARLAELADDDEALLYLDWLRSKEDFTGLSRDMATIFLHQPAVAGRLDAAIRAKRQEKAGRQ